MPDLFDDDFDAASPVPEAAAAASPIDLFAASTPQGGGGAPDVHRAGLEVLRDCVDGALCLAFAPPPPEASAE